MIIIDDDDDDYGKDEDDDDDWCFSFFFACRYMSRKLKQFEIPTICLKNNIYP